MNVRIYYNVYVRVCAHVCVRTVYLCVLCMCAYACSLRVRVPCVCAFVCGRASVYTCAISDVRYLATRRHANRLDGTDYLVTSVISNAV